MAARLNPYHDEKTRNKIRVSQLLNRLQKNALGEIEPELSQGQIRSIEAALDRALPKLSAVSIEANVDQELTVNIIKYADHQPSDD